MPEFRLLLARFPGPLIEASAVPDFRRPIVADRIWEVAADEHAAQASGDDAIAENALINLWSTGNSCPEDTKREHSPLGA